MRRFIRLLLGADALSYFKSHCELTGIAQRLPDPEQSSRCTCGDLISSCVAQRGVFCSAFYALRKGVGIR